MELEFQCKHCGRAISKSGFCSERCRRDYLDEGALEQMDEERREKEDRR